MTGLPSCAHLRAVRLAMQRRASRTVALAPPLGMMFLRREACGVSFDDERIQIRAIRPVI